MGLGKKDSVSPSAQIFAVIESKFGITLKVTSHLRLNEFARAPFVHIVLINEDTLSSWIKHKLTHLFLS